MNNFYTKIVGMISEKYNLMNLEQWFDISVIFFSFLALKNITNKNQVTILLACVGSVEINLDVVIASCNL
jgi:hypothetical protein